MSRSSSAGPERAEGRPIARVDDNPMSRPGARSSTLRQRSSQRSRSGEYDLVTKATSSLTSGDVQLAGLESTISSSRLHDRSRTLGKPRRELLRLEPRSLRGCARTLHVLGWRRWPLREERSRCGRDRRATTPPANGAGRRRAASSRAAAVIRAARFGACARRRSRRRSRAQLGGPYVDSGARTPGLEM